MNKYRDIKSKLYDLLAIACCEKDEDNGNHISQNLGISMTNAVKRGGVVNIISQSITIQRIVPKIIEVMQKIDALEYEYPHGEVLQIEHLKDPVEECCEFYYNQNTTWREFSDAIKRRYMDYVCSRQRSNSSAARFLDVHPSYVTKSIKQPEMIEDYEDCQSDVQ